MNLNNRDFVNVAYLLGVSFEYDSRAVIGADLDGDGKPDLLVAEYRFVGNGYELVLHVYRNELARGKRWVGVKLPTQTKEVVVGTKVLLVTKNGRRVQSVVNGDSFLSQHPLEFVFGLAESDQIERLEVAFPGGTKQTNTEPKLNSYWTP